MFKTLTTIESLTKYTYDEKHDFTRSLSEFWSIQTFSLHCDEIGSHQYRESGRVAKPCVLFELKFNCYF